MDLNNIKSLPKGANVFDFTATIGYVNDPENGQYGTKQRVQLITPQGNIYAQFKNLPAITQADKGRTISMTSSVTKHGVKGVSVDTYTSRTTGELVHSLSVTATADITWDNAAPTAPRQPQTMNDPAPASRNAPPQTESIDDQIIRHTARWLLVHNRVREIVAASGTELPHESLCALTTHINMSLPRQ